MTEKPTFYSKAFEMYVLEKESEYEHMITEELTIDELRKLFGNFPFLEKLIAQANSGTPAYYQNSRGVLYKLTHRGWKRFPL